MNKIFLYTTLFFVPSIVFAHAYPIEYFPQEFSVVENAETEVSIHFSENVLPTSNKIDIFGPDGKKLVDVPALLNQDDQRILLRDFIPEVDGIHVVSWQGISAIDGHHTKGAFSFFVGSTTRAPEIYGGTPREAEVVSGVAQKITHFFLQEGGPLWSITRTDAGRSITLSDRGSAENTLRLVARTNSGEVIAYQPPTIQIFNVEAGVGPLVVPTKDRGGGAYDIPWEVFVPGGDWRVSITFKHEGEYDISATVHVEYPEVIDSQRASSNISKIDYKNASTFLLFAILLTLGGVFALRRIRTID